MVDGIIIQQTDERETKDGIGFYVKGGFQRCRREDEGREERTGQGVGAGVIMKLVLTIKGYDARTRRVGDERESVCRPRQNRLCRCFAFVEKGISTGCSSQNKPLMCLDQVKSRARGGKEIWLGWLAVMGVDGCVYPKQQ